MVSNILYVSCLCSDSMMHKLFDTALEKNNPAPQKFHTLLVRGLDRKGVKVTNLVTRPVTIASHPDKKWWKQEEEVLDGIRYVYIPFYNSPYLKILGFKLYAFFFTLLWILRTKGSKAMVCDVLYPHASASMKACRLLGINAVGIVTDIPGMMVSQHQKSIIRRFTRNKSIRNIRNMTHLVPLTDAMCDIINPERKTPYIVMEGLVDKSMEKKEPIEATDGKRHITYTGTLNARYGVKTLIESFLKLEQNDIVLDIYGQGPMESEMSSYTSKDPRIIYHGIVPIEEAVLAQRKSFLLVNPRPTSEEFTKYSFPSKNMEYMVTGVPLLTAVLPGMPKDYYPNVFLFEDETVDGLSKKMNEILSMPCDIVREKGQKGKKFVLENKNNIYQAERLLELIDR